MRGKGGVIFVDLIQHDGVEVRVGRRRARQHWSLVRKEHVKLNRAGLLPEASFSMRKEDSNGHISCSRLNLYGCEDCELCHGFPLVDR